MSDYISRKALALHLNDAQFGEAPTGRDGENRDYQRGVFAGIGMAIKAIEAASPADVRPVVFCKDCRFNVANMENDPNDCTDYTDITCSYFMTDGQGPFDFCSNGERCGADMRPEPELPKEDRADA